MYDPNNYNPQKMFPSISKHLSQRDPEISWMLDVNGNILEYFGDKFLGTFRIATEEEVLKSPGVTTHETKEPCPFLLSGQFLIRI